MSTRRSSRSRRQAHTIYDDAKANLNESSARKKQRIQDADEDDSETESRQAEKPSKRESEPSDNEESGNSEEDEDEETSDVDEPFEKPKRKSPFKTRVRKSTSGPARTTPAKQPKKGKPKKETAHTRRAVLNTLAAIRKKILKENETVKNSILAGLLEKEASPAKVARRIALDFSKDPTKAVDELAQLIFRSVGGGAEIPTTDWEHCSEDELSELLSHVVKGMEATPQDQVLLHLTNADSSSRAAAVGREFRKLYEEFWRQLGARILVEGLAVDDDDEETSSAEVIKTIMERLINLAHVGVTDIRAAATLAIYQMGLALVERAVDLNNKLTSSRRQLEAASNQARKKAALTSQIESYEEENDLLGEAIEGIVVSAVFMKRYKDINPQIRVLSIEVLSQFMIMNPETFLKNIFLKYMGWLLSDKDAAVRDCAVRCFKAPIVSDLDSDDVKHAMEGAVTKFLPRLCDCVLDVDIKVQESAMELFVILMKNGYLDSLDDNSKWDQLNLRALATDASPKVRYHALMFVIEQLEPFDQANSRDTERSAVEKIRTLVQWIVHMLDDGVIPLKMVRYELVDFCVTSLRSSQEYKKLICNWSAMLKVLETETTRALQNSADNDELGDRRVDSITQRVMLRMLATAVEMEVSSSSSTGNLLEGTIDGALAAARKTLREEIKAPTKKRNSEEASSHEELTSKLLVALPDLLTAYKTDPSVVMGLIALPQYFDHGAFNLSSHRKHFLKLIDTISDIFLQSTETSVLSSCVLTLTALCSREHSRAGDVRLRLKKVARSLQDRLLELLLLKTNQSGKKKDTRGFEGATESKADIEQSICLCLRRLQTMSQRLCIVDLLVDEKDDSTEIDKITEDLFTTVSEYIAKELNSRKIIPVEDDESDRVGAVPEIWEELDGRIHQTIATSIQEGITCLLTVLAWRLQKELGGTVNDDTSNDDYSEHIVVRMRDRLLKLLSLCFEQYLDTEENSYSAVHTEFSNKVQMIACRTAGDVRTLFPKAWQRCSSPFLSACALIEDDSLIGGTVRFLRAQEKTHAPEGFHSCDVASDILLSMARGLAVNWKTCNRREAGMVFAHMNDESDETKSIISLLSSVAKTIDPYRLLEAHLACLTQSFDGWLSTEPEEPESDQPSEEEMATFDEACANHRKMFKNLDDLSGQLSASLGKAKLSKTMVLALRGFFRAGVEYAFLAEDPFNEGEQVVGMRLAFLRIIAKYLNRIKGDSDGRKRLLIDINEREEELRRHPDFDQILDEDREALSAFRKIAGFKSIRVETGDEKDAESNGESDAENSDIDDAPSRKRDMAAVDSPSSKRSFHSQSSHSHSMENDESEIQRDSPTPGGRSRKLSMTATDDSMSD